MSITTIDHIDEIARTKLRDVAGIFFDIDKSLPINEAIAKLDLKRAFIVDWLNENRINWKSCFDFFDGNLDPYYKGDIYVDIPIKFSSAKFSKLLRLLENEDETSKIEGVLFKFYRYEDAVMNADFYMRKINDV